MLERAESSRRCESTPKPVAELEELLAKLEATLGGGYTVVVDGRRSGEALAGAMPAAVGIRAQYIPEFDVRYGDGALLELSPEAIGEHMEAKRRELAGKADEILAGVEGVTFAGRFWHETEVRIRHEYAEILGEGASDAVAN